MAGYGPKSELTDVPTHPFSPSFLALALPVRRANQCYFSELFASMAISLPLLPFHHVIKIPLKNIGSKNQNGSAPHDMITLRHGG